MVLFFEYIHNDPEMILYLEKNNIPLKKLFMIIKYLLFGSVTIVEKNNITKAI